ncbi:MAG: DedA family protein [Syntrophorhabdaceae bacterium]|nr:DedA family protein [Syntrophorhabdaceae bacterium]
MEGLIEKYGYIGIFIGTFLEGETTVLMGGVFSRFGYLNLTSVMVWSFLGTFIGDFFFFGIGRYYGKGIVERYDFLKKRMRLADKVIHLHGNFIIFLIRFLAGIRTVVLILLGCTNITLLKFLIINGINSIIWSVGVTLTGYIFGNVVFIFIKDVKGYERYVLPAVFLVVVAMIVILRYFIREREKRYGDQ